MAVTKGILEGRTSSCLRKYRIFFVIVSAIMCIQIYLAYSFFILDNQNGRSIQPSEISSTYQHIKMEDSLQQSKQLKLPPDKSNTNNQSSQNRTPKLKLDKDTLGFVPACEITGKESISAVTRARTQICKESIVNISCLNQYGNLYPERLYSLCPHSKGFIKKPTSLGCFQDDKINRILGDYYAVFKSTNSPKDCAFLCLQSGYPYAGTEYSIECFCGSEEPSALKRLPDSHCNMKCPGNRTQFCGGYLRISVWHTGIQKFKAQEARNISLKTEKEPPIRIAYLLTLNGRASRQVKRLINILYDPSHFYYIHVDARQDYMYREMLKVEKACKRKNIIVAKGAGLRHASIWGGASLLTTFLTSAQQMLQYLDWDFLVNLSESDYPIKTNKQLIDFLTLNKGLNFVKSHGRDVQKFISKQGLDKTFFECEARMWRLGDRKLSKGIQIDGGSDWVALSRNFVEYVSNPKPDALVSGLLKIFQYTLLPAESFFHTVLRNSKFCDTYVDNNLHVTNWKRKLGCKCQYKAIVDWCGCSPNDFKLDDFIRIKMTKDKNLFFARKFEPVIDQRIIDKVEQWLYPERDNNTRIASDMYWQNIYHHGDLSPLNDDLVLTISNSLARIVFFKYFKTARNIQLLETTAYFRENKLEGILILTEATFNISKSNSSLYDINVKRIEALIKFKRHISINKKWLDRVVQLSVNTDYDKKEQTFRNFLNGIGPLSNPVFSYEFNDVLITPKNLTVLWIQPNGFIVDINHLEVEETSLLGSVKPSLDEPLQIGEWHVVVLSNTIFIGQMSFFVTPLQYWKNRNISWIKSKELNHGSNKFKRRFSVKWYEDVIKKIGIHQQNKEFEIKVKERVVDELDEWVDDIVKQQYTIEQVCSVNPILLNTERTESMQECSLTNWSSLSPDPKSEIDHLSET
ncbi:xylosyltransferase oxt [Chelonus insularis]|uniref:xylosyltransferase oxt n=1 Tax=Chelonus insularis TaxID=460826 RepID=UPI00158CAE94|nr:xylosyltransferase oxt [Chelonus insularis]